MAPKIFSPDMSKYIKETLGGGIGQEQWDWLRGLLLPSVVLTSRSKLQTYTIENNVPKESFNNGYWIRLDYALPTTFKEILELKDSYKPSANNPALLKLRALIVLMYDGSGSHLQMQGKDINISTRNLIIIGFRSSKIIDQEGNLIHLEENQSDETFRTTGLCPGKESRELVEEIVERLDREAKELPSVDIELNGVTITIDIDYHPGIHKLFSRYFILILQITGQSQSSMERTVTSFLWEKNEYFCIGAHRGLSI